MKITSLLLGIIGSLFAIPAALSASLVAGVHATVADAGDAAKMHLILGLSAAFVAFVSSILVVVRVRIGLVGLLLALAVTAFSAPSYNLFNGGEIVFLALAALCAFFGMRGERPAPAVVRA